MNVSRAQIENTTTVRHMRIARQAAIMLTLLYTASVTVKAHAGINFSDVTSQTGIMFKHTDGSSGKLYLMETVTAGLALSISSTVLPLRGQNLKLNRLMLFIATTGTLNSPT